METLHNEMIDNSIVIFGSMFAHESPQDCRDFSAGQTIFVDSVQAEHVANIDSVIRGCQQIVQSPPKFILAARDAKTEQLLKTALMGLIAEVEVPPVQILEHLNASKRLLSTQAPLLEDNPQPRSTNLPKWKKEMLWLRGGLPDSLTLKNDVDSLDWRKDYLDCILHQDLSKWAIEPSDRFSDVFQWIANTNGEEFDEFSCSKFLLIKKESLRNSLDLLVCMGLLRRLPNWPAGANKINMSKSKYYVRDSGLLHAMHGISTETSLHKSKNIGHSWEGFCIESIINVSPKNVKPAFYRDKEKNEIDLVLKFSDELTYAIEIKLNDEKSVSRGFHVGCNSIGATHKIVVHAGESNTRSVNGVSRLSLISALQSLPQ